MKTRLLFIALGVLFANSAHSQSSTTVITDVQSELNARLSNQVVTKQRTVKEQKTQCHSIRCPIRVPPETASIRSGTDPQLWGTCDICRDYEVDRIEHFSAAPVVMNVQVEKLEGLSIREADVASLPERLIVTSDELVNCSETAYSSQRTLSHNVQTGYSVTVTRSVAATNSLSGNISAKLPGDVTVGGTNTISTQVTTATAQQESKSETAAQSHTVAVSVPAGAKLRVKYMTSVRKLKFPFAAQVVVDGPLDPNVSGVSKASQLIRDEATRSFPLEGFIIIEAASAGRVVTSQEKASSLDCTGAAPSERIRVSSFVTTLDSGGKSSLLTEKESLPKSRKSASPVRKSLYASQPLSYPGAWCQTQPCNLPLDGYRKVCYRDENLYCNDCRDEPDSVCSPEPPESTKASAR